MKANSFLGSYLRQEDVDGDTLATISAAKEELVGADKERCLVVYFEEFDKGLVFNATNINVCNALFGTDETDDWMGKKLTVYVDPNVMFGGKKTGGIRVKSGSPESN